MRVAAWTGEFGLERKRTLRLVSHGPEAAACAREQEKIRVVLAIGHTIHLLGGRRETARSAIRQVTASTASSRLAGTTQIEFF
jgi:hypothetical protein